MLVFAVNKPMVHRHLNANVEQRSFGHIVAHSEILVRVMDLKTEQE